MTQQPAIKGTTFTLPKGTVVFRQGGDNWDFGGTVGRLASDALVELNRTLDGEDDLAAMFVAAKKPELLSTLKGTYTPQGTRIEGTGKNMTKHENLSDGQIDQPEIDRLERQKLEDDRLQKEQIRRRQETEKSKPAMEAAKLDELRAPNLISLNEAQKGIDTRVENVRRDHEQVAEEKSAIIAADLAAKAAVADEQTIKDDINRAKQATIDRALDPQKGALEQKTPEEVLNVPDEKKIAPDFDTIEREAKAVELLGAKNAAVAKADKDAHDLNAVPHKDGTQLKAIDNNLSEKETVKKVDETTNPTLKEAKAVQKDIESDVKDTSSAEKVLKENKATIDNAQREAGKVAIEQAKSTVKPKSSEVVDKLKEHAFDKKANPVDKITKK